MTTDEMRRQMQEMLGASPIPDESLARYAILVGGLSDSVRALARDLAPEDEPHTFLDHLERLAEARHGG